MTPHTSAVGVMLRPDPADPSKVAQVEVPLAVPAGRTLWQGLQQQHRQLWGPGPQAMGMQAMAFKCTPKVRTAAAAAAVSASCCRDMADSCCYCRLSLCCPCVGRCCRLAT